MNIELPIKLETVFQIFFLRLTYKTTICIGEY